MENSYQFHENSYNYNDKYQPTHLFLELQNFAADVGNFLTIA